MLTNKRSLIEARANMFQEVRAFFKKRGVVEVDVPSLARGACIDPHIHLIEAKVGGLPAFLHSSPEYYMKRLLVEGVGDCYQMGRVYRDGEVSERHNPEFTMVEWYRLGYTLPQMIMETVDFAALFVGEQPVLFLTYQEVFTHFLGYYPASREERDYFFAFTLDSYLEKERFVVIQDFPEEEAALAQVEGGVAKRFELFYRGLELANGYLELRDPEEHRRRLASFNERRVKKYPVDLAFLEAMEHGLPACSGVAVGFDRLMMSKYSLPIDKILPFPLR